MSAPVKEAMNADWQAGYTAGLDDAGALAGVSRQQIRSVLRACAFLDGDAMPGSLRVSLRNATDRTVDRYAEVLRLTTRRSAAYQDEEAMQWDR